MGTEVAVVVGVLLIVLAWYAGWHSGFAAARASHRDANTALRFRQRAIDEQARQRQ
jgi:hypothetical protein